MKVQTKVDHFENKTSSIYYRGVKVIFSAETLVELIFDSSMFGTYDYEVHIVFAPRRNLAAYLPPRDVRHIS